MRVKDFSSTEELIAFVAEMRAFSASTAFRNGEQTTAGPRRTTRVKELAECDAALVDDEYGFVDAGTPTA